MADPLTQSEYARQRGVVPQSIAMHITRGHLRPPALLPDGKIDPELADAMLAENVDPVRAASARARVGTNGSAQSVASSMLLNARAVKATVEAEEARRKLNLSRGRYCIAEDHEAVTARLLGEFLAAIDQGLGDLEADAKLTRPQALAVRKWWRELRTRQAAKLNAAAALEPEFLSEEDAA